MNKKNVIFLICCIILTSTSCSTENKTHLNEVKSKTVEVIQWQEFSKYAVYNPELKAGSRIESDDVPYAVGRFILLSPTLDKLKYLYEYDYVELYYNQTGQVLIEIKGH